MGLHNAKLPSKLGSCDRASTSVGATLSKDGKVQENATYLNDHIALPYQNRPNMIKRWGHKIKTGTSP